MGKELLTLRDVSKYYTSGQSVVMGLNCINLTFCAGEFVAITGESGSGKSTLSKVIAGILPYESGEMVVNGRPTSHYDGTDWEHYRGHGISFISQSYDILPGCTVLKNVVSALRITGMDKAEAAEKAEEILREVELWELKSRRAAKLSSGQKQRLSIARALAKPAQILIADEPTGNLDSENSAKVIELLARAAKERLVLMVTHDFDEAADTVSRRVVLRDGVVVSDVTLRPANSVEEKTPKKRPAQTKKLGVYTARLQMSARPVWSTIMLLFFALTAFAVFAFLGTFIVNLDDSHTRLYDPSAFPNGDTERIVVVRADGGEMTQADFDALLAAEHVEYLERYGYVTDITYFYRQNVDYSYHYNRNVSGFGDVVSISRDVTLDGSGLFLKTVPLYSADTEFLTAGRLPETMYEVVAVGDPSQIGKRFPVYIQDTKNWNRTAYLHFMVEVVGVTDQGSHLYFSDQLGRSLTGYAAPDEVWAENNAALGPVFLPYVYEALIDETLLAKRDEEIGGAGETMSEDGENVVKFDLPPYYLHEPILNCGLMDVKTYITDMRGQPILDENGEQKVIVREEFVIEFMCYEQVWGSGSFGRTASVLGGEMAGKTYSFSGMRASGYHGSTYLNAFTVPAEAFDWLVRDGYGDQVSVYMTDFAYADRVVEALNSMGYIAMSPYINGTTLQDPDLAAERMNTLKVCLLALVAAILLQIVVLRAMFTVETEEFRLLANLGLDRRTARRSVFWQVVAFAVGGQILGYIALFLCRGLGVERIVSMLHYLPWPYLILLSAVHFAASLLTAWWIMGAVRRQVYPFAGLRPDLNLDGMEEEVGA